MTATQKLMCSHSQPWMAFLFYFDAMNFILLNGIITEGDKACIAADNSSYRYGDGLFETMKVVNGEILLASYHFERLFAGLKVLQFAVPDFFSREKIMAEILLLCKKNHCGQRAKVRLSVSRGSGGLYDCDNRLHYLAECLPLEKTADYLNADGLVVDVFPDAEKSCDRFSNLKSANYLPYVMAALWAKENKLDDALVLNQHQRICDATIANIFCVKNEKIFTPPLSEGCVAGVMRRLILNGRLHVADLDLKIEESLLTGATLLDADEVFLTNAVSGIRWVKQCRNKLYSNTVTKKIFDACLLPLYG